MPDPMPILRPGPPPVAPDPLQPYDAVLLLSFGGPERPEDVLPFLQNVTAGRGIPPERLAGVAEHYHLFGGRSPINAANRALLAGLGAELERVGSTRQIYWGNRNWAPFVTDALRRAHAHGARRVLAVPTSAYPSYSGCRQYREDLGGALTTLAAEGRELAVDKIRHYADHPGFVLPAADAVRAALAELPAGSRLVFVTHSIPVAMDATSGPEGGGYTAAHRDAGAAVAARAGVAEWDLAFCSRSGPPSQPWLEPDVNDHLADLAARGVPGVAVAPIGFVSDHMEVVFDLDTEARRSAAGSGLKFARTATVGTDPRFVEGLVDLMRERAARARGEAPPQPALGRLGPWHDVCPAGCCPNPRGELPAACGADWSGPVAP